MRTLLIDGDTIAFVAASAAQHTVGSPGGMIQPFARRAEGEAIVGNLIGWLKDKLKATDIRDAEGLKLARQFAAITDDFEQILHRMVKGGEFVRLNLNKHRDESAARRMVRSVIR